MEVGLHLEIAAYLVILPLFRRLTIDLNNY